jgi:hypothetical protein
MEFEVGGDDGGGEFGISSCSSAGAPYLRGNVMEFLAVLAMLCVSFRFR